MEPKLFNNYRHLTMIANHDTRTVHPRAIPYGTYSEGLVARVLVLLGFALFTVTVVSMLMTFKII